MNDTTVYVGLDVHKDTITTAYVGVEPEAPVVDFGTLGTQQYTIDCMLKKLPGRPKLVYEAGPCGFWLHRYLTDKGFDCGVTAPRAHPVAHGDHRIQIVVLQPPADLALALLANY